MSSSSFRAVLLASTLLDVLAVLLALFAVVRRRQRISRDSRMGLPHIVTALAAGGVVFLVKLPLHAGLGVNLFGLMHLVYLDAIVIPAAMGIAILVLNGQRALRKKPALFRRSVVAVAAASLATIPLAIWASWIEPYRLHTETADVPILPPGGGNASIRVGVLADLQTDRVTGYERLAIDRLMSLNPDIILVPGDVFQGTDDEFERELPALRELTSRLCNSRGAYVVPGNVDLAGRLERLCEGTGVRTLANETVVAVIHDRRVAIGGVELNFRSPAAREAIQRLGANQACDVRILLSHLPDAVLDLKASDGIDLVVAGHTHGGQIQIPGFGPLVTFSHVPRRTAAGGLTKVNDVLIYVSRGVGFDRGQAPPLRLFCPPEITLLTLVPRPSPGSP